MIYNRLFAALTIASSFAGIALGNPRGGGKGGNNQASSSSAAAAALSTGTQAQVQGGGAQGGGAQAVLNPANVQAGSAADGQGQVSGVAAGQAASAT